MEIRAHWPEMIDERIPTDCVFITKNQTNAQRGKIIAVTRLTDRYTNHRVGTDWSGKPNVDGSPGRTYGTVTVIRVPDREPFMGEIPF